MSNTPLQFEQIIDGEWYEVENLNDFKHQCCDCGLVHDYVYEIKGNKLYFKVNRNNQETNKVRKEDKIV